MKKILLSTAVMLCLTWMVSADAKADSDMTVTFESAQGCVCRDLDHWTDASVPGGVLLTCPSPISTTATRTVSLANTTPTPTNSVFYADAVVSLNTVREYTCGTVAGATAVVSAPNNKKKALVSAANITCAKGYTAKLVSPASYPQWYVTNIKKKGPMAACVR